MKLDAIIKWNITNPDLNIHMGKLETILIDADYVEADEDSIYEAIENELASKHETSISRYKDFVVTNLADVIDDLSELSDDDSEEA